MDLSSWLRRRALPCPLVITAPGGEPVRWAVEAAVSARGWATAPAPAQADLLVVCGEPGPELSAALRIVWAQVPGPRARVQLTSVHGAGQALDAARARLSDDELQRAQRRNRTTGPADGDMPGGLMMADVGPDRDGLALDQLHPVLGPALTAWPAGLRVDATMQGDVLQEVSARLVDDRAPVSASERALRLDALATVLCVLMCDRPAREAARLRDAVHVGAPPDAQLAAFAVRLGRSRRLRAATRGLGVVDGRDVHGRLLALGGPDPVPPVEPELLDGLLVGTELATARLIIGSLGWARTDRTAKADRG